MLEKIHQCKMLAEFVQEYPKFIEKVIADTLTGNFEAEWKYLIFVEFEYILKSIQEYCRSYDLEKTLEVIFKKGRK